jgi:MEMO1 family protein
MCRSAVPAEAEKTGVSSVVENAAKGKPKDTTMNEMKKIENAFEAQTAGQFYPAEPRVLRKEVEGYLSSAKSKKTSTLAGRDIVGLIAPHAGYIYSGPVAGEAYRAVQGKDYRTVVVAALSHRRAASKISLLNRPAYDTPLGSLPVDKSTIAKLLSAHPDLFSTDEAVFKGEHSLEVQLPFIQVALPNAKIVPIIAAVYDNEALVPKAAQALFEVFGNRKDVLFVASTDLTHFFPYKEAAMYDTRLLALLEDWRIDEWRSVAPTQKGMCGHLPVSLLVDLFSKYDKETRRVTVLDYRNSGDTSGDKENGVVGYGAAAFTLKAGIRTEEERDFGGLSVEDRRYLMKLAKDTVRAAANDEVSKPSAPTSDFLKEKGAAFVTLKKNGNLRGCIGHVIARVPLFQCVSDTARAAAIHDTRFSPVRPEELPDLSYEISVLTAPAPTTPEKVKVGRDGLIMTRGGRSGLLLPQVPVEWGWTEEEFLSHTCIKAGLSSNCWRDPETVIESFRAVVFGEEDLD